MRSPEAEAAGTRSPEAEAAGTRSPEAEAEQAGAYRRLAECAHGFMASQVLFAACELGVFDALDAGPGPLDLGTLATRMGTSAHGTQLLLDTCVALELLTVDTTAGAAVYANTELSRAFLARRSPQCQRHMLLYLGGTTYRCWAHLAAAVREGRNQYARAFGVSARDPFAAIYRSEAERLLFQRGLQEVWSVSARPVLAAFELAPFRLVCDLGGGSGALARAYASLYPEAEVTVVDTPDVVRMAETHFPPPPPGARVRFRAGDFFRDALPEADLYILARVLHDWPDAQCSELLRRVHRACRPGGGVLLVESVLREDGRGPLPTLLLSLNMLLQTAGRERSPGQYRALLAAAGFGCFELRRTGGAYDAMLARK